MIIRLLTAVCRSPVQAVSLAFAGLLVLLAEYPGLLHGAQNVIDWLIAQ